MICLSVTSLTYLHANVKCLNVISYFLSCPIQLTPATAKLLPYCYLLLFYFDLKR